MIGDNQNLTFDLCVAALIGLTAAACILIVRRRQRQREAAARADGHALGSIHGARIYAVHRGDIAQ